MRLLTVTFAVFIFILVFGRGLYWVVSGDGRRARASGHRDISQAESNDVTNLFRIDGQRSSAKAVAINQPDPKRVDHDPTPAMGHGQSEGIGSKGGSEKNERAPIKFKKVRVMGRMASPRLDFTQESLPVERVDEPMRLEFFQKVFEPVGDYSF